MEFINKSGQKYFKPGQSCSHFIYFKPDIYLENRNPNMNSVQETFIVFSTITFIFYSLHALETWLEKVVLKVDLDWHAQSHRTGWNYDEIM